MCTVKTLVQTLEQQRLVFESETSLEDIMRVMSELPSHLFGEAVSGYQKIIRQNNWFFPSLEDVDLTAFIRRWELVHVGYFELAKKNI